MTIIGTLIHPLVKCHWGGVPIHSQVVGEMKENMLQEMTLTVTKSDAPKLTFRITANPFGFKLFKKLSANLGALIRCEYGYRGVSGGGAATNEIHGNFKYSGMQLTTGMTPSLEVTCVGDVKVMGTRKMSRTFPDAVRGDLWPEEMKTLAGEAAKNLKFDIKPEALKNLKKIDVNNYVISQSPYKGLQKQINPLGMQADLADTMMDGGAINIRYPAGVTNAFKGDETEPATTETGARAGKRKFYIIGLGIATNLTRKQEFPQGEQPSTQGASGDAPMSDQVRDTTVSEKQKGSLPADMAASPNETGTSGVAEPPNASFTNQGMTPEDGKKAAEKTAQQSTKLSFECLMVPLMVGIKPNDIVGIVSLKGDFIEDYEVEKVVYRQNAQGVVMLSIEATRPYTGGDPMDQNGVTKALGIAKKYNSKGPDGWTEYYWNQGPDITKTLTDTGARTAESFKLQMDDYRDYYETRKKNGQRLFDPADLVDNPDAMEAMTNVFGEAVPGGFGISNKHRSPFKNANEAGVYTGPNR